MAPEAVFALWAAFAAVTSPDAEAQVRESVEPVEPFPVPVLLLPGWLDSERDLAALRIRLIGAGWPSEHVEAITFQPRTGSNRDHADEVAAAVERLIEHSGAERIDIVAHSMGGLAARVYLRNSLGVRARRVVFLASPHRGTLVAYLAFGEGGREMVPGSEFLDSLNERPLLPAGIEAITVRTPFDLNIVPGESALLPGYPDYVICCPTHAGLLRHPEAFEVIRMFLAERPASGR
jgi:triacylglycerol lipase